MAPANMTTAQLNTLDLPEVESRAPREKSRHWAMRSGPRRFVTPDAGQQNDWLRRDIFWEQEEEEDRGSSLSPVPEEGGDRFEGEEETLPNATVELAAFLPTRPGRRFGRRGQRKHNGLSASWVWGTRSAATRVVGDGEAPTAGENSGIIDEQQQKPEWPPLRRAALAGDENAEAWEVCSTVSSLASSWAVLQEEQSLLGLLPTEDAGQPEAAELREKKQEEAPSVDAASTSTPPALSFAEAVLLRPAAVPVPATATAGVQPTAAAAATRASTMMSTASTSTSAMPNHDEKQEEPVADATVAVEHWEEGKWPKQRFLGDSSAFAGAEEEEKDDRGPRRWTKASKGPRSVRQRERVAKACEKRRTAVNPRGEETRGRGNLRGPEDREGLDDAAAASEGEETKMEKRKVWRIRRELSYFRDTRPYAARVDDPPF